MDDWIQSFSLTIADVVDVAFHAPLRALLGWAIAAVLAIVMISTLASADGQRAKVVIYIALGLIVYAEILRPVGWMLWLG